MTPQTLATRFKDAIRPTEELARAQTITVWHIERDSPDWPIVHHICNEAFSAMTQDSNAADSWTIHQVDGFLSALHDAESDDDIDTIIEEYAQDNPAEYTTTLLEWAMEHPIYRWYINNRMGEDFRFLDDVIKAAQEDALRTICESVVRTLEDLETVATFELRDIRDTVYEQRTMTLADALVETWKLRKQGRMYRWEQAK